MNDLYQNLRTEFQDQDYRYGYAESFLNTKLAAQIKTLREQRGKTQAEVAALMGITQPGYRRFEDVNHSVWKTDTLWSIAKALGVRLKISFDTFGSLLDEKRYFAKESLKCPPFEEDPAFKEQTNDESLEKTAATKAPPSSILGYLANPAFPQRAQDWDRLRLSIKSTSPANETAGGVFEHVEPIEQMRKGAALAETAHQIELTPRIIGRSSSGANPNPLAPVIPINKQMSTTRKRKRAPKRGVHAPARSVIRGARYAG